MATRIVLLPLERASDGGAILARSHADYPSFRHLFPKRTRRIRALQAIFTGVARDAARLGSAYSAVSDDDAVLGVAIWLPPGGSPGAPGASSAGRAGCSGSCAPTRARSERS